MRFPLALLTPLIALGALSTAPALHAQPAGETPVVFEAQGGRTADGFAGSFQVPERRGDPDSRMLTLHYVRFPATTATPAAPIVYLAGGPGGSGIGTARGDRFALFMALRAHADVIAFDQRGTGESNDVSECRSSVILPEDRAVPEAELVAGYRDATRECLDFWQAHGVDIRGYTTVESARDLDALRRHLGAERVSLWGISYGTHLALAAMREMDGRLERVILASAEGLDQTVKLPARTDAYFARLQAAVDSQPGAHERYPDIAAMIRRVHAQLRAAPVTLHLAGEGGSTADVVLDADSMQRIAAAMIADPRNAAMLLGMYRAIESGDLAPATAILSYFHTPGAPITLDAMSLAMDIASGIDADRMARVLAQRDSALLGDYLNFPMPQLSGSIPGIDLGEGFRKSPVSDVPTLLLTGTLDGRTYPEAHREAVSGLTRVDHVIVENAGHNLFMVSPEVTDIILAWLRGEHVDGRMITIALPDFVSGQ